MGQNISQNPCLQMTDMTQRKQRMACKYSTKTILNFIDNVTVEQATNTQEAPIRSIQNSRIQ